MSIKTLSALRKIAKDKITMNGTVANPQGIRELVYDNPNLTPEQNAADWEAFNKRRMLARAAWNKKYGIQVTPAPHADPNGTYNFTLTPNMGGKVMAHPLESQIFTVETPDKSPKESHVGPYGPMIGRVFGTKSPVSDRTRHHETYHLGTMPIDWSQPYAADPDTYPRSLLAGATNYAYPGNDRRGIFHDMGDSFNGQEGANKVYEYMRFGENARAYYGMKADAHKLFGANVNTPAEYNQMLIDQGLAVQLPNGQLVLTQKGQEWDPNSNDGRERGVIPRYLRIDNAVRNYERLRREGKIPPNPDFERAIEQYRHTFESASAKPRRSFNGMGLAPQQAIG